MATILLSTGASPWTPSDSPTDLWLDAADAATIDEPTAVSAWSDKSGNNITGTQTNVFRKPFIESAAQNGLDTIRWGTDHYPLYLDELELFRDIGGFNIFIALKHNYRADGGTGNYFYAANNSALSAGGLTNTVTEYDISGNFRRSTSDSIVSVSPRPVVNQDQFLLLTITADYISTLEGIFTIDGQEDIATSSSTMTLVSSSGNSEDIACDSIRIGFVDYSLGEVILIKSVLTDEDRYIFEGYLAHKWGTESNLPSDHVYKDSAPEVAGNLIAASSTSDVGMSVDVLLSSDISIVSDTDTINIAVIQNIAANILNLSNTSLSQVSISTALSSATLVFSSTADISIQPIIALTANILVNSVTSSAAISTDSDLVSSVSVVANTSGIDMIVIETIMSAVTVSSNTSSSLISIFGSYVTNISILSNTDAVVIQNTFYLSSNITVSGITSDIVFYVRESLASDVFISSNTQTVKIVVNNSVLSSVINYSNTSAADLGFTGSLSSSAVVSSNSSEVLVACIHSLSSVFTVNSNTPYVSIATIHMMHSSCVANTFTDAVHIGMTTAEIFATFTKRKVITLYKKDKKSLTSTRNKSNTLFVAEKKTLVFTADTKRVVFYKSNIN